MTFAKWVRTCDEGEHKWIEYQQLVDSMDAFQLLREFFTYLDYCEQKENGPRYPISISCGRVMMSEPLQLLLTRMREVSL